MDAVEVAENLAEEATPDLVTKDLGGELCEFTGGVCHTGNCRFTLGTQQ